MMLTLLLQVWGGACYLSNKICFSRAERCADEAGRRTWRIRSWVIYLLGVPAWVTLLSLEHNWIAAAVEAGGSPAMLTGLVIALRGRGRTPAWLDHLSKASVVLGLTLSCYEFGGIRTLTQVLELGIAAGFLLGTYLTAKQSVQGYFWLMLGNVTCAALMGLEGYVILMIQQSVSLVFVIDACRSSLKRNAMAQAERG